MKPIELNSSHPTREVKSNSRQSVSDSFKSYLESQGKSKSTIIRYNAFVLDFLAYLDRDNVEIENVSAKEVLSYLAHLQKPIKEGGRGQENKTRAIRLGVIKQFFYYQIEQKIRTDNPIAHLKIRGIKAQKLYPLLNQKELEQIYCNYTIPTKDDPKANKNWFTRYKLSRERNKVIISLMINQALTTAEVNRIELNDLKLREGEIYIKGTRKSQERTLKLKSNQILDLMEYTLHVRLLFLECQEDQNTKKLFLSVPTLGKQKTNKDTLSIWKGLSKEVKKQNPKFINFKQVRTTIITKWLKQYNLREVQYMAGHKYISSTEAYLVNNTEDLQEAIDQFHPY